MVANRSRPIPVPSVLPTVLQMVVVRMNQERIVTTQNQFVTKYANIFQKQQNQYQTHTNILFGAATRFELELADTSTLTLELQQKENQESSFFNHKSRKTLPIQV